jgi:AcrR family transcriptional regulator
MGTDCKEEPGLMSSREKLKNMALELIGHHGLDVLSYRLLAQKSNLSLAAVNHHFPKKSEFILELIEDFHGSFGKVLGERLLLPLHWETDFEILTKLFQDPTAEGKKNFIVSVLHHSIYQEPSIKQAVDNFLEELVGWVELRLEKPYHKHKDPESTRFMAAVVVSWLLGATMVPGGFPPIKSAKFRELLNLF